MNCKEAKYGSDTGKSYQNGTYQIKEEACYATRGHKLLKDKRDELMRQFLDMARENMALREKG